MLNEKVLEKMSSFTLGKLQDFFYEGLVFGVSRQFHDKSFCFDVVFKFDRVLRVSLGTYKAQLERFKRSADCEANL